MFSPRTSTTLARRALIVGCWVAFLVLWEAGYRAIGWKPWVFPAPSHVLDAVLNLLNVHTGFGEDFGPSWPKASGVAGPPGGIPPLITALAVSGVRLAIGFSISLGLGLLLGLLLWRSKFLNSLLGPLSLGLQTLPSVCWVPLAVLTLGIGERGIMFVLVMGSIFSIAVALRDGLGSVPPIYRAAGRMLGASGMRLYTHVLLPACLPALAGALRQGFAFTWRSLLGAELILMTQRRGIGFLLAAGRDFADIAQVVGIMAIMIAVGMSMDRWVFRIIEQRVRRRFGLSV